MIKKHEFRRNFPDLTGPCVIGRGFSYYQALEDALEIAVDLGDMTVEESELIIIEVGDKFSKKIRERAICFVSIHWEG